MAAKTPYTYPDTLTWEPNCSLVTFWYARAFYENEMPVLARRLSQTLEENAEVIGGICPLTIESKYQNRGYKALKLFRSFAPGMIKKLYSN